MSEKRFYRAIKIEDGEFSKSFEANDEDQARSGISGLGQINFLVGPNNSGKSRLLRALFRQKNFSYIPAGSEMSVIKDGSIELKKSLSALMGSEEASISQISAKNLDTYASLTWMRSGEQATATEFVKEIKRMERGHDDGSSSGPPGFGFSDRTRQKVIETAKNGAVRIRSQLDEVSSDLHIVRSIYIPILRGLRPLDGSVDPYLSRTIKDYEFNDVKRESIFTGVDLYRQVVQLRLGTFHARERLVNFEKFLSKEFFDGKSVDLIPMHEKDVLHLKIGDEEDRPIYSLGDGIQSIIILTFLAFTLEERHSFFIEEPDLYLHPGMQRKLIEVLVRYPKVAKHQYFFTTHSNHMLDMSVDYPNISIFLVRRIKGEIKVERVSSADRTILHEIGARSSSVFLTNATIWVEGVTDRLYLREYLNKYLAENTNLKPIKEDTHFSFIEFGGNNLVHFSFSEIANDFEDKINALKICGQSMLILDGDNEPKGTRLEELKAQLGDGLIVLKPKEIENTLPEAVVREVALKKLKSSRQKEEIKDSADANLIQSADYENSSQGIGKYLDDKLGTENFFGENSTTLTDKTKFCEAAINLMQNVDFVWKLSPEGLRIAAEIYKFVALTNDFNN